VRPLELPSEQALQALLEGLELYREHPATLEVHDAAYGLLRLLRDPDDDEDATWRAFDALARAGELEHPLRASLLELVGKREVTQTRTLQSVLAGVPGLPVREDTLEVLEMHLKQQGELRRLLEQRQEELVRNLQRLSQLLNMASGVVVVLFILASIGWAMAFDWFSVIHEPVIDEGADEEEQVPAREGLEDRSKRQ
jgi:hypothetical protein